MTNSKTTKKALLSSILALTMCVAMLIATTFAWFTDTASTAVNKIQSGTLDVDIVDESGNSLNGGTLAWQKASDGAGQEVLWEPGVTYNLQPFKIVNKGSLALKYEITINGITGDAKLLEAITFKAKINEMNANGGFISYLSLKNISIEGITFNKTSQTAIALRDNSSQNKGSTLYVNGFTVKDCEGTGDTNNTDVHFFAAGSGAADETFCGIENGVKGLNNITITGCKMNSYYQAIAFNNSVATLNNLTVSGNTFTGCTDNNVQISNKVNKGLFTFSNNTLVNMNGRFVRMANAAADAVITVDNTTVATPEKYDGEKPDIFKVTGVSGFKVVSNGNSGWTIATNDGTTWTANGNTALFSVNPYNTN